ncbi:MAG: hypothetical protein ACE5KW_04760, partial [Dehalococcoidia bacterium]
ASLLFAHYWNRARHGGGGLPWVLGILWSSTWILIANSAIFGVSKTVGGGAWAHLGLDWKPLLQEGLTATYLALLAADAALAAGWWRVDLSGATARLVAEAGRQPGRAAGQLLNMALGVGLAATVGVIVINVR